MSEYLILTAVSMTIFTYFGGLFLNYLTIRQMFFVSAIFPIGTIVAGIIVEEKPKNQEEGSQSLSKNACV